MEFKKLGSRPFFYFIFFPVFVLMYRFKQSSKAVTVITIIYF